MCEKPWVYRYTGPIRNFTNRRLFAALSKYAAGDVLDVGGWDFFTLVRNRADIRLSSWTTLEIDESRVLHIDDARHRAVVGDGCRTDFADASFDTYVNICVLEHVYDPIAMVEDGARVLRPGGHGVFLIPQTTLPHMVPHHYYNFTRYWIEKVMPDSGLDIVELVPIGGLWQDVIAHFFYALMYTLRAPDHDVKESTRNPLFWVLLPFMAIYVIASLPILLVFGLSDFTEGARHYLVVARKAAR